LLGPLEDDTLAGIPLKRDHPVTARSWLLAAIALLTVPACAGLRNNVSRTSRPDPGAAYIGGRFESVNGAFGIVLRGAGDDVRHITFVGKRLFLFDENVTEWDVVGLTAIPPGDYRVSGWSHGAVTKPLGEGSALARPFHVDAGQIVFLGNFDATFRTSTLGNTEYREWSITPMAFRADEVVTSVRGAYPAFADVPITCLFCDPPAEDAAIFALPARAPADGTLGKSSAVLHYRRHAGYDGWALFAWETFQEPEDLLAPGDDGSGRLVRDGSWKRSLAPDGTDAFGIYWRLDEADFRNGRVNLLVRSQSATEGRPRFWLLRDSHEAWINEGDPTVYLSRAQAEAAWKP
jgi:hypothetical protein